jgi:hypothetical protein
MAANLVKLGSPAFNDGNHVRILRNSGTIVPQLSAVKKRSVLGYQYALSKPVSGLHGFD